MMMTDTKGGTGSSGADAVVVVALTYSGCYCFVVSFDYIVLGFFTMLFEIAREGKRVFPE